MNSPLVIQIPLNASRRQKDAAVRFLRDFQRLDIIESHRTLLQQIHRKVLIVVETSVDDRHGVVVELPSTTFNRSLPLSDALVALLGILFVLLLLLRMRGDPSS